MLVARRGRGAGSRWNRRPPPVEAPPAAPASAEPSEFADFLSEIAATVAQQVDAWRAQGRRGGAALGGRGVPHRPARGAAGAGDGGRSRAARSASSRRTSTGSSACRPKRRSSRPTSPARPPSGTRTTSPRPRSCSARPARARIRRRRPRRSGGWRTWSRPPATASRSGRPRGRRRSPAGRYNPLVIVGASGVGQDPPAARARQRARGARCRPGGLPQRARVHRRADRGHRPRRHRRLARALPPGRRASCSTTCTSSPTRTGRQDELFVLFNLLLESGRQMVFTSAVPLAELTGVEPRLRTRLEGGLVVDLPAPDREIAQRVLARRSRGQARRARPRARGLSRLPPGGLDPRGARRCSSGCSNAAESAQGRHPTAGARARGARGTGARPPAPPGVPRAGRAGIVAPARAAARSREKMVWDWPDVGERMRRGVALMAIKGSLKEASLPDVIQLLFLGRRTGASRWPTGTTSARSTSTKGRSSTPPSSTAATGWATCWCGAGGSRRSSCRAAIAAQEGDREHKLGEILVGLGALPPGPSSSDYIRLQIEEAVYYLFTWTSGTFNFEAGVRPEREDFLVRINPESLLLEGARRVDEWSLIEKKIPSFDLIFSVDQAHIGESAPTLSRGAAAAAAAAGRHPRRAADHRRVRPGRVRGREGALRPDHRRLRPPGRHVGRRGAQGQRQPGRGAPEPRASPSTRPAMLDEALREFRRVADLRPTDASAPFFLGLIALRQARWEEAAAAFRQAAEAGGADARRRFTTWGSPSSSWGGWTRRRPPTATRQAGRATIARIMLGWSIVALKRGDHQVAQGRLARTPRAARAASRRPALWYWAATLASAGLGRRGGCAQAPPRRGRGVSRQARCCRTISRCCSS